MSCSPDSRDGEDRDRRKGTKFRAFALLESAPVAEVDPKEIRALANLARLQLSDEQVDAFAPQVSQILGYLQQLAQVDVEGVEPFVGPELPEIKLRADEPAPAFERAKLLSGVPENDGVHVLVPKFKEES